ncbi:c-type heme family protein [Gloeobacter kilaueensis]|uniref:Sensor with HAMP domain n=1 Tax=Gloeobacter kilaueensis (strain ATCC BAA-2537 / CCAP 1431/1 / ULC 316 / JS1) TaxID=1183438 RepID=U5QNS2_GLOK1|nr:DUF3365 domain-containing protein [Gloeobacter kilaueensis]AGY59244.1 sensor with HAMP domain [Gloeobacter kilaueensis JS1]
MIALLIFGWTVDIDRQDNRTVSERNRVDAMLKNLKLGTKFSLILILIFVGALAISGSILSLVLQQRAQDEVTSKADVLLETMNSVRNYTNNRVKPLLASKAATEPTFISETASGFAATEIFEGVRKNGKYNNFLYKEAAPNPTNLRDKADDFEAALVSRFTADSSLKELTGFRSLPGGDVFFISRPLRIPEKSCLQCHSTPAAAPKSLLTTYGSENGFNWKLGAVVAAQTISVPVDEVYASAWRSWSFVMGALVAVFVLLLLVVNSLLKRSVIRRIGRMAVTADAVSTGQMEASFSEDSTDEIGTLATAFNRMKASLEIALKLLNQQTR